MTGVAWGLIWLEEYEAARALLSTAIAEHRASGAVWYLAQELDMLAELDFRTGRWASASALASESLDLHLETGQRTEAGFSHLDLAYVEAARGRDQACKAHARSALALSDRFGITCLAAYAGSALGLLELGRGRPAEAIAALAPVERFMIDHAVGEPTVVQWAPDLVEAYVHTGRGEEATTTLTRFATEAAATGRTWALATAARCRGLLAGDGFQEEFEEALRWHEKLPTPFERARTELRYGERLRRAGRRVGARERLRSALGTFERLGADPWAERARTELAASGEHIRKGDFEAREELTPQELQVALVVARGSSNKEAAAQLFLSPKTIEFHLGRVYRKLGVRSRTQLANVLGRSV